MKRIFAALAGIILICGCTTKNQPLNGPLVEFLKKPPENCRLIGPVQCTFFEDTTTAFQQRKIGDATYKLGGNVFVFREKTGAQQRIPVAGPRGPRIIYKQLTVITGDAYHRD